MHNYVHSASAFERQRREREGRAREEGGLERRGEERSGGGEWFNCELSRNVAI